MVVFRDDDLPHQIRINYNGVSCNCRRSSTLATSYDPFAPFTPLELRLMLDAYNDPANHRGVTEHEPMPGGRVYGRRR